MRACTTPGCCLKEVAVCTVHAIVSRVWIGPIGDRCAATACLGV